MIKDIIIVNSQRLPAEAASDSNRHVSGIVHPMWGSLDEIVLTESGEQKTLSSLRLNVAYYLGGGPFDGGRCPPSAPLRQRGVFT